CCSYIQKAKALYKPTQLSRSSCNRGSSSKAQLLETGRRFTAVPGSQCTPQFKVDCVIDDLHMPVAITHVDDARMFASRGDDRVFPWSIRNRTPVTAIGPLPIWRCDMVVHRGRIGGKRPTV